VHNLLVKYSSLRILENIWHHLYTSSLELILENVMLPLVERLYNGVRILVVSGIYANDIISLQREHLVAEAFAEVFNVTKFG
jgi:hypothetical protein